MIIDCMQIQCHETLVRQKAMIIISINQNTKGFPHTITIPYTLI